MRRGWDPDARMGSLSQRTVAAASDVLAGRRGGLRAYLAFVGPAVVASIAYMDPGNFATNIQAGARYGYTLLWVVLLANIIAMCSRWKRCGMWGASATTRCNVCGSR